MITFKVKNGNMKYLLSKFPTDYIEKKTTNPTKRKNKGSDANIFRLPSE